MTGTGPLTVKGSKFGSGKVTFYVDSTAKSIGTATATSSGTFSASLNISGLTGGSHTVIAVGADGSSATAPFTVSGRVTLSATSGPPGKSVTATVTGYKSGEVVTFRWSTATGVILANLTASTTGAGSASLKIPSEAKKAYSIYAVGSGGTSAHATFTVN